MVNIKNIVHKIKEANRKIRTMQVTGSENKYDQIKPVLGTCPLWQPAWDSKHSDSNTKPSAWRNHLISSWWPPYTGLTVLLSVFSNVEQLSRWPCTRGKNMQANGTVFQRL